VFGSATSQPPKGTGLRRTALRALTAATAALALSAAPGASGIAALPIHAWNIQPVITSLNEPRGLAFDAQANLYVAEAGLAGTGTAGVTHSGAISKYRWAGGSLEPTWSTAFASIFTPSSGGGTQVLGPSAVSATRGTCATRPHHRSPGRAHGQKGCLVQALLSESGRGVHADFGLHQPQLGRLFDLSAATGAARSRSDVGDRDYAWTAAHVSLFPADFPDANPYAVLTITGKARHDRREEEGRSALRTFVADAASNTVSEVLTGGRLRVISYIPNETAGAERDATPTCIAQGPGGDLYVGALDLLSNLAAGGGQSNVWRVDPNAKTWRHNATLWASGFTTINGCTFDSSGHFWASELLYPNASGPPGDLAYASLTSPDTITHVVGNSDIALPGGIAEGPDKAMYVSTGSADTSPRSGAVLRVSH
jgi:hypothetical protein